MKISKIMAGISALALAASMMAFNVSATDTQYLYTVQKSWNGQNGFPCPADEVEGTIKFQDATAKGACDLNAWDSGDHKYNGQWVQYVLTSDDLSNISIKFTVVADDATQWEYHTLEEGVEPDDYQLFLALGATETISWNDAVGSVDASTENNTFVNGLTGSWEYTFSGADIQASIDNETGAKISANDDGTYNLGMNIQVGHVINAKVTGEITGDTLYTGASDVNSSNAGGDTTSSSKSDTTSSSKTDTSSKAGTDSKSSTTSSGASTTSSKSGSANGTTSKTTTSGSSSAASDNTNAGTGATAGLALAGIALAGAAIVVAKRK